MSSLNTEQSSPVENISATYCKNLENKIESLDLKVSNVSVKITNQSLIDNLDRKTEIVVNADQEWQKSTFFVKSGDKLQITAEGKWTADKRMTEDNQNVRLKLFGWVSAEGNVTLNDRYTEYGPRMMLIGKINDTVFPVGETTSFVATESGELEFAPNDLCCAVDNAGIQVVKIKISKDQ